MLDERDLIAGLKEGNKAAFTLLFRAYYKDLVMFAGSFCPGDRALCEDVVQSVFLKLWEDRKQIVIESSMKSYLLKAVRNKCLDELRHQDIVREHENYAMQSQPTNEIDTENYILYSDLQKHLQIALAKLPDDAREAFEMNRFVGLKYREIAEKLNVSERTVDVRVGKAIALLRKFMREFL